MSSDLPFRHFQVNQKKDLWSIVGIHNGVRISGLSENPDGIVAELYTIGDKLHRPIGSVSLRYGGGPDDGWHGIEDIMLMIESHNAGQGSVDN